MHHVQQKRSYYTTVWNKARFFTFSQSLEACPVITYATGLPRLYKIRSKTKTVIKLTAACFAAAFQFFFFTLVFGLLLLEKNEQKVCEYT